MTAEATERANRDGADAHARDLDGLGIGRVDFPMLAERHVAGLQPLTPAQLVSLRRL